jgi:hypothetical protein
VFAVGPYSNSAWANTLYATTIHNGVASTPVRLDNALGGPSRPFVDVDRDGCTFPPTDQTCCHDIYHGAWSAVDNACIMSETERDASPRFSPFYQGGYFWLVFTSRRDYGNDLVGTPRLGVGAGRPLQNSQLWVTAIDPSAEFDPSFAPYWLPGQDVSQSNVDAQWSVIACSSNGEDCSVDADCCSGICGADGMCTTPPPDRCHAAGETCGEDGDCCGDLICQGNICSSPFI